LLRPHTLTASFVPVFVGSMFAFIDHSLHAGLFFAMLIASMLIQAATNMFNEYYDFARGLDNEQSVGIGGTIVRDGIAPKTVLNLAFVFFGIAMLLGVYICIASSWWIAVIGLICMLFGYLYTGGPYPIAYTTFGELSSGFLMGTVIIGISYYIQTLTVTAYIILLTIPVAICISCIILATNISDLYGDNINGRNLIVILIGHKNTIRIKTISILIRRKNAIRLMAVLFIIAYTLTILYMILGILPIISIIVLLSSKKAIDVVKNFQGKTKPIEMLPAMIATGKTNTMYGFL